MNPPPEPPGAPPLALLNALSRLLRPLVRLLIHSGVTFTQLSQLLKAIYVETAERDFQMPGKAQTDSRISLLTGVHRKDVRRLRGATTDPAPPPPAVSLGGQIVARWISEHVNKKNVPLPLPRAASKPGAASFESLVRAISTDIRPRAVLDEWQRLGVARVDSDDQVWLNVGAFVPEQGFAEKAFYFGRNLHDHIAAGAHNLIDEGKAMPDRSVHYSRLTPASIARLEGYAESRAMTALTAVNRLARKLQAADQDRPDAHHRINFGIYLFTASTGDPDRSEPAAEEFKDD